MSRALDLSCDYFEPAGVLKGETSISVAYSLGAFPEIISSQNMQAYNLYEYAVIFCIFFAAIVDVSVSALYNKEFLTDAAGMSLTLSYFPICTITAFRGDISTAVRIVTVFLLAGAFLVLSFVKKHSFVKLLKGIPVAVQPISLTEKGKAKYNDKTAPKE